MLLFTDYAVRHMHEYILKYKSEALEKFRKWIELREKESGKHLNGFSTDGGGEYASMKLVEYPKSEGILKEKTMSYTSQSNRVVEWANCMIMECAPCMLDDAALSKQYWAVAVSVTVYLKHDGSMRSVVGNTL